MSIHLAAVGHLYEGPGLTGRVLAILNVPSATLCGVRAANSVVLHGTQVVMPHDHPTACRACLKLLPSRRSLVVPMMLPG